MNNPHDFAAAALKRFNERHAAADSILFNSAGFVWNAAAKFFEIEVRGMIVATPKTLAGVKAFSEMHNNRLLGS